MPLTARCHSLRPERTSGWLAFFELVPRGGRAAHFLVVGPADNADRGAHEVALRGAQAAVRYLKEVPSQAPASTILGSVSRLLSHEAREAGAEIEFGCAVLEQDRICTATHGRVRLLRLGEDPGRSLPADLPDTVSVSEGERFFFGRLPRSGETEAASRDFLNRLEHGGGGDGGLVVTLTHGGEGTRLDLAPREEHREDERSVPEPATREAEPAEEGLSQEAESRSVPVEPPSGHVPEGKEGDASLSGKRHEWKTVDLPPRPDGLGPGPRKPETLPMWEEVDLPGSEAEEPPADEERHAPAEPAPEPPAAPPAPREDSRQAPQAHPPSAEPFSELVSELRGVFDSPEEEPSSGAARGEEERSPADLLPPDVSLEPERRVEAPEPDEVAEAPLEEPEAEPPRATVPTGPAEPPRAEEEGGEAGEEPEPPAMEEPPTGGDLEDPAPVVAEAAGPAAPKTDLYAPEETRGLGFWLAVVAAVIALGALVVYLTLVRPRIASSPEEEAATPAAPQEEAAASDIMDPAEPTTTWTQSFEGAVTSSPLVAGSLVIFGCRDGRVYALDRATGRREWAYAASDGFGSSPALAGDLVIIGGYDGRLYGLDLATGEERWNHDTGGRVVASPAVDGETAYVGSYNRTFYAVSLADGAPRWSRDLGSVLWASPTLADDLVVAAGLDGTVTALDRANGRVRWQARTGGPIYSSPVIAERKVIVGSQDGSLHAFDLASGETSWTLEAGSAVDGSPGYHEGRVVVGTNEGLVLGVDVGMGRIVWRVATGGEVKSRPAFRGRLAWLTGYDGYLHGIEWLTGAEAARYPIDSSAYSSPAIGDGTAYFGTMDGRFLAVHLGGAAP